MKNTIKMSLVAALAVAGLSSTASAKDLAEAIKGVNVSGQFQIDLENNMYDGSNNDESTVEYDLDITFKAPVNDNVTAVLALQADNEADISKTESTINGTPVDADEITISDMYFQYVNGGATVLLGKQNIGTPMFDDEKADGITALYNVGPVTLAAAHRVNANAIGGNNEISAAAVIGSFGPVNASLWYATAEDADVENAYSLAADAKFDIVSVAARYTSVEYDVAGDDTATLGKIMVGADIDAFNVHGAYAWTTDSVKSGASFEDGDAESDFYLEQLSLDAASAAAEDINAFLIGAGMSMGDYSFGIDYAWAEGDRAAGLDDEASELLVSTKYDWGKNLDIEVYYSDYEEFGADKDRVNLEIEYKF